MDWLSKTLDWLWSRGPVYVSQETLNNLNQQEDLENLTREFGESVLGDLPKPVKLVPGTGLISNYKTPFGDHR